MLNVHNVFFLERGSNNLFKHIDTRYKARKQTDVDACVVLWW